MLKLPKYSFGIGDRFGQEGAAQLKAILMAKEKGITIAPVWNKSNREHTFIHSEPFDQKYAADQAIKKHNFTEVYFVDADHINLGNVDKFIDYCNFYTIDVADYIGKPADKLVTDRFVAAHKKYIGAFQIPGVSEVFTISETWLVAFANKFLFALEEASKIYSHIASKKGVDHFVSEVSMDEVNEAQSPVEMFFILGGLAMFGVPAQTIAPKFTGRFNKGVDYVGDVTLFAKEFEEDLLVIDFAIKEFNLPENLKLSVHSGSDKFSIYPAISQLIKKHNKGIHIKTAGTTWLEELIGLALAGGSALDLAKNIYYKSLDRIDDLCKPYATVIDIKKDNLPSKADVEAWTGQKYADSLRHIPGHKDYNPDFRQLLHVAFKIAAEYQNVYIHELLGNAEIVGEQVTQNLFDRHMKRLFFNA